MGLWYYYWDTTGITITGNKTSNSNTVLLWLFNIAMV